MTNASFILRTAANVILDASVSDRRQGDESVSRSACGRLLNTVAADMRLAVRKFRTVFKLLSRRSYRLVVDTEISRHLSVRPRWVVYKFRLDQRALCRLIEMTAC